MLKAMVWTTEKFRSIGRDEKGVTALEYGVLAAGIIAVIAAIIFTLGTTLQGMFQNISNTLAGA